MTAAQLQTWPGSRQLASWWGTLRSVEPRALWIQHLLLHHLEALVGLARPDGLDRLYRLLLESLAARPASLLDLTRQLHFDGQLLQRLLTDLDRLNYAVCRDDVWSATSAGRQLVAAGDELCTLRERRPFYFVECAASGPPRYLPLEGVHGTPWTEIDTWKFDPAILEAAIEQSDEWKRKHQFPLEIRAVYSLAGKAELSSAWQEVIVDRAEYLSLLLVLRVGETQEEELLGFAIEPNGRQMLSEEPVLQLGTAWREVVPELKTEPNAEQWRQAWRAWGQPRNLPPAELEACELERIGPLLRVRAPARLVERLRAARSDAIKSESWLLAGEHCTRSAALIELVET